MLKIVYVLKISLDNLVYDDLPARLPTVYCEFAEFLANYDIDEQEKIFKIASTYYEKMLRAAQVLKTVWGQPHKGSNLLPPGCMGEQF